MRITLVISSLQRGGAERVMSTMANYWAARGHEITLFTADPIELDTFVLHPQVRRVSLELPEKSENAWQGIKNNIPRIRRLRRFLRQEKADVIISFMDRQNVMTLIATFGLNIPVIISERVDPRYEKINFYWNLARRLVYRFADALVIQAENIRPWTKGIISPEKVFIIPNPIHFAAVERNPAPETMIIGMGRLVYQKGFDLLIEAFARCVPFFPEWELTILGEGPERENLTQLIAAPGLTGKVHLPGVAMNPLQDLQKASLFVLSSRWEGFPNVLLEAMACGLPVISFDCPSGPGEIIRHEVDGLLIPPQDVGALVEAMKRLMNAPELREKLAGRGQEVTQRFDLDTVMQQWEALFKVTDRESRFQFGKNWQNFLTKLTEERIVEAELSLKQMLQIENLHSKRFLDVGSGSGLFSLAARRLGAAVHSFDYDRQSVACTQELKRRYFPDDDQWTIAQGSVLDTAYLKALGEFDVVYAWGVLHHTGDMWQALENVVPLVAEGGKLFIAIYNDQGMKSKLWRQIKFLYTRLPRMGQMSLVLAVGLYWEAKHFILHLLRGRNPLSFTHWREKKKERGMAVWYDLVDWVGGYPFEVATPGEIFDFYTTRNFTLTRLVTVKSGHGNNQFVFIKKSLPTA